MSLSSICVPKTFSPLGLFGTSVLRVEANLVSDFNATIPTYRLAPGQQFLNISRLDFCNVTVSYTHPGQNDEIHVETWLPTPEKWNGRFKGTGGGGWNAGRTLGLNVMFMMPAIDEGFAATATDAGVPPNVADWVLVSKGNANQIALHNFAARSLEEQALIGKAVVKLAYKKEPEYSYFEGCSQGGRQALMLASRYPTLYDGIAANAPAWDLNTIFGSWLWPPLAMNLAGENAPHECEMDAITTAAIAACDKLDGVKDGHVDVEMEECLSHFDPFSIVGRTINCTANLHPGSGDVGQALVVSRLAAKMVNSTWAGTQGADDTSAYVGPGIGTDLTGNTPNYVDRTAFSVLNTDCKNRTDGEVCVSRPNPLGLWYFQYFTGRDPTRNFANVTREEFNRLQSFGGQEYVAFSPKPDLTEFHKAGGKMLTFHGMLDQLIPARATESFYKSAASRSGNIQDYWRYFPVQGLHHCSAGTGSTPYTMQKQLQAWVENGTAPASSPVDLLDPATNEVHQRLACPFPQRGAFSRGCGDPKKEECWSCTGDLGAAL
ncbi:hypothetical protein GGTG_06659 [Gaeumannomyces tritici R3-111a-1]|uniref:Carboxylic ester hydrolase n=1 Tax=Gaeumannomyces tritici (strain R3-111a-1) TaxID=644352 RepID=J3NZG0_GAET3|nr:hypothetical protein GGTG_06659 [Gaeumannomyces tritici R3-111a-1]EJT76743.1 hypothetical protein GGTG_06659 [Gaeumannomyces tritici R3-111a-1]